MDNTMFNKMTNKILRVMCLYRVSTLKQLEKEDIPMQRQACREFAEQQGWKIVDEKIEKGVSGFKVSASDRDAIQEIQRNAIAGKFDILLVFMFDRLGRKEDEKPFVVEWFVQNGVEVWSVMEGQQRFDSHVINWWTTYVSAIMDNMNEGIILTNKQGNILLANRSVLRIFDKNCSVAGKNMLEFLRDVSFSAYLRDALDGTPGEMSMERAGLTYRVYFSHVSGGGAIILFLDITEKAKSEKLRREFSANVSHELKTPLTSTYGSAEMLYNGYGKEADKQAFYGQIKDKAGHLIALIENIILISKLDEGGRQEIYEEVELAAIAAEAVDSLSLKAEENKVAVHISGGSVYINANRSQMYEMFFNLLDNAIKYNKPGGVW